MGKCIDQRFDFEAAKQGVASIQKTKESVLPKRDIFKGGAIALEALSETTNGDADSVMMNPA
jgi:hypothetical protein